MTGTSRQLRKAAKTLGVPAKRAAHRFGGRHIVDLLNSKPGLDTARERVAWMVEACHRLIALNESILLPSGFGPGKRALIAEAAATCAELNARLSRFHLVPLVLNLLTPDRPLRVQYQLASPKKLPKQTLSEALAATWLTGHLETVYLIRRCDLQSCRRWFFAAKDHQKWCSDTCRQEHFSQGESFKKKRAEYMRQYRRDEKDKNERSKRRVGFSEGPRKRGR